jgi:arsenical pump membrane protein
LANSASLLLPVSNLTNLLAFSVSGLSFLRFAGLMLLPQLCVLLIEYVGIRLLFRNDLGEVSRTSADGATRPLPRVPLVVIGATLAGFVVCSAVGIDPAWAAGAGAATLGMRALWQRRVGPAYIVRAAHPGFLLFVLALAAVVRAVQDHGLRDVVDGAVPNGSTLLALLGVAALAAVLANVLNNLPATLLLLPVVATAGVGPLLAMLIGVNVGPNLTYTGSLATLLWRRALPTDVVPGTGDYVRLGLLTVPAGLVVGVVALWVGLRVF